MTVHAIKNVVATASKSPERQALAAAIESVAEAERAEEAGREAVTRAVALVREGELTLAAANAAVVSAKERHSTAVAAAIGNGVAVPSGTLKAARAAQADAEDDFSASSDALTQWETKLSDLEASTASAHMAVEVAINALLATAALPMIKAIAEHRTKLMALLSVSYWIARRGSERHGTSAHFSTIPELAAPLAAVSASIEAALRVGTGGWNSDSALAHPVLNRWADAVAALRLSADAPLPNEE
jgi:Tfp pilus assembly protein PilX